MRDRRYSERTETNIACIIYLGTKEITGVIINQSRDGLALIQDEFVPMVGDTIDVTMCDKFYMNDVREISFYGNIKAIVKNMSATEDGRLRLGCQVADNTYQEYVDAKQVNLYISKNF